MNAAARTAILHYIRPLTTQCRRMRLHPSTRPLTQPHTRRHFATPPPIVNESTMELDAYHVVSDAMMDGLLESLEALVDSLNDSRYEVEYSSGVLTLNLGDHGTYVINKQPPNRQIWLSSPFSGPKRYDYSEKNNAWFYSRDGMTLGSLLNAELGKTFGRTIDLGMR